MKHRILSFMLMAAWLCSVIAPAYAQAGSPPGSAPASQPASYLSAGTDGKLYLNASALTKGKAVSMQVDGIPSVKMNVAGVEVCAGCMTFNTYTTASGSTVVVPTAYTAIMMAVTGKTPFNTKPESYLINGALAAAMKLGAFDNMGLTPDQVTPENILHTLKTMDPLLLLRLNATLNNPNNNLFEGQFMLAAGLFEFNCDPFAAECVPVAEPRPMTDTGAFISDVYEKTCEALGDCSQPPTDQCPRNFSVTQGAPFFDAKNTYPPNPVVVGQDPAKTGVDVSAQAINPPVVVKWNLERRVKTGHDCVQFGDSGHGGCDGQGADDTWGWKDTYQTLCERHTRVFADPIVNLRIDLSLDAASIAWITTGELQSRYPGAHVYQADWPLFPGIPPTTQVISPDGSDWKFTWAALQIKDPGQWLCSFNGITAGTPYTRPRPLANSNKCFYDAVIETALTK